MYKAPPQAGVLPPPDLVAAARKYVDRVGLARAVVDLGTSRQSLAALVAGLRVRRGTIVVVAQSLGWPGVKNVRLASDGAKVQD
jgi:hypothetical protein